MQEVITKQEANVKKLKKDRDAALMKARELQFHRNADKKRKEEKEENDNILTPPSTEESTAEPTEEELEAIEPVEVRKETAYYLSPTGKRDYIFSKSFPFQRMRRCVFLNERKAIMILGDGNRPLFFD
jgi:hypothetical protein